ncbi:MAG TPA: hypothetical protein VI756_05295 [Blastocatellia bacterium]
MKEPKLESINSTTFTVLNMEEQASAIGGVSGPISEVVTVVTTNAINPTPDTPDKIIDQP